MRRTSSVPSDEALPETTRDASAFIVTIDTIDTPVQTTELDLPSIDVNRDHDVDKEVATAALAAERSRFESSTVRTLYGRPSPPSLQGASCDLKKAKCAAGPTMMTELVQRRNSLLPRALREPKRSSSAQAKTVNIEEHLHYKSLANLNAKLVQDKNARIRAWFSDILSGVICGTLMFVFASVFSFIIFERDTYSAAAELGVEIHLFSAAVSTFLSAHYSGCKIVIAGPDINPTVFLAAAAAAVDSEDEHALPTLLFTIAFGTMLVGGALLLLGHFRLTRVVQFVPAPVLSGFLASVGFKVFVEAIAVATGLHVDFAHLGTVFGTWGSWKLMLPALPVGLLLWYLKRKHIGSPIVILPSLLFIPLVIFYIILAGAGVTVDEARKDGWFFREAKQTPFYDQWAELYGHMHLVDVNLFLSAVPDVIAMVIIVVLDFLLKLAGTEKSLKIDLDMDNEFVLAGKFNLFNALSMGVPSYGQMKFNVLNYNIIGNVTSPRAGYFVACFCTILFFSGVPLINFLPRFFASALLVYAGMGFLVANLWDNIPMFSKSEIGIVWSILVVNVFFGLLYAVVIGVFLAAMIFAIQYSKRSVLGSDSGKQVRSSVMHPLSHELKLQQLGEIVMIVDMEGFIFFGTATTLLTTVAQKLEAQKKIPPFRRLRYLVLEFSEVCGIDSVAAGIIAKVQRRCKQADIKVIFCGLHEGVLKILQQEKLLDSRARSRNYRPPGLASFEETSRSTADRAPLLASESHILSVVVDDDDSDEEDAGGLKSPCREIPLESLKDLPGVPLVVTRAQKHYTGTLGKVAAKTLTRRYGLEENIDDPEDDTDVAENADRMMNGDTGVTGVRSTYPTLDLALEHIEDRVIHYANLVRSKWLIFPAMKKLNALANYKALHGPFHELLEEYRDVVWQYMKYEVLPPNTVLFRVGDIVDRMYLLQYGRVSSYLEHKNGTYKRVSALTHGAFGASSAILGHACSQSVVVDSDSVFITISGRSLTRLEADFPHVALALQRAILNDVVQRRSRLTRFMDDEHEFDGYDRLMELCEVDLYRRSRILVKFAMACVNVFQMEQTPLLRPMAPPDSATLATSMYPGTTEYGNKAIGSPTKSPRKLRAMSSMEPPPLSLDPTVKLRPYTPDIAQISKPSQKDLLGLALKKAGISSANSTLGSVGSNSPVQLKRMKSIDDDPRTGLSRVTIYSHELKQLNMQKVEYVLSNTQRAVYSEYFHLHSRLYKGVAEPTIAVRNLRHAAMDLGYYESREDMQQLLDYEQLTPEQSLNEEQFLSFMKRVCLQPLPADQVVGLRKMFNFFDNNNQQALNSTQLLTMLRFGLRSKAGSPEIPKEDVMYLMREWSSQLNPEKLPKVVRVQSLDDSLPGPSPSPVPPERLPNGRFASTEEEEEKKKCVSDDDLTIKVNELLSMMAYSAKRHQIECALDKEWARFAGVEVSTPVDSDSDTDIDEDVKVDDVETERRNSAQGQAPDSKTSKTSKASKSKTSDATQVDEDEEVVTAKDIQRVVEDVTGVAISLNEALEMLWVADTSQSGSVNFKEFVEMLSIVFEPGWIVHWSWRLRRHHRFAHDLYMDGEFDTVEDNPEPPSPRLVSPMPVRPVSPGADALGNNAHGLDDDHNNQPERFGRWPADAKQPSLATSPTSTATNSTGTSAAPSGTTTPSMSMLKRPHARHRSMSIPRHLASDALDPLPRYLREKAKKWTVHKHHV